MKKAKQLIDLIEILILGAIIIAFVSVVVKLRAGGNNSDRQLSSAIGSKKTDAYPPPENTTLLGGTPPPPAITLVEGENWPTKEIITRTPFATATVRPNQFVMPVPIPGRPDNPAGIVWFTNRQDTHGPFTHFLQRINGQGRADNLPERVVLPEAVLKFAAPIIEVYPSPNGRYIVLMVLSEPLAVPFVVDLITKQVNDPLSGYAGGKFLGWHPDGKQFLFDVDGGGPWMVNVETSEITQLAYVDGLQGGAISPDGTRVAYIEDSWPEETLWLVSTIGGDAQPMFKTGGASYLFPTSWSPDGTNIVYYGECGSGSSEQSTMRGPLCLYDFSNGEHRSLRTPSFARGDAVWSPDGQHIAVTGFSSDEKPCEKYHDEPCHYIGHSIYVENVLTGEVKEVTRGISPVWSPDGSLLAFLSYRSGAAEIWLTDINGNNLHQLTSDGQNKSYNLIWSREIMR